MNIHELIATRRTTFQFQDKPVPEAVIERALEAARWAPNHKMTQPWRFILPGPQMLDKLQVYYAQKLVKKMQARGFSDAEIDARMAQKQVDPIPAQIIVYNLRHQDDYRRQEDYAATCCGIQNLMLSAWADGVASGWKSFDSPEAYELCGLDPETYQLVGLIQLGYALREKAAQRLPLESLVTRTA